MGRIPDAGGGTRLQDYGDSRRTPFVRFYRDRTVFWNPGHANVPAEDLLDRTARGVRPRMPNEGMAVATTTVPWTRRVPTWAVTMVTMWAATWAVTMLTKWRCG